MDVSGNLEYDESKKESERLSFVATISGSSTNSASIKAALGVCSVASVAIKGTASMKISLSGSGSTDQNKAVVNGKAEIDPLVFDVEAIVEVETIIGDVECTKKLGTYSLTGTQTLETGDLVVKEF